MRPASKLNQKIVTDQSQEEGVCVLPWARAIRRRPALGAGSPSVRANCAATAAPCPAMPAMIPAPEAVKELGAVTASPAIHDNV